MTANFLRRHNELIAFMKIALDRTLFIITIIVIRADNSTMENTQDVSMD